MTASGHAVQVMGPLFTIPSTLKRTFSTSTISSSYGLCSKTNATNGTNHIFNRNLRWIEKNIGPFLLEAYRRLIDSFQPIQGLFDHGGSSPSVHALHGQGDLFQLFNGARFRYPKHQNED
jgi:hypothetical protein